jgi:hypothetical protein
LAYSFSAPTASITLDFELADALIDGNKQSTIEINTAHDTAARGAIRRGDLTFIGICRVIIDQ